MQLTLTPGQPVATRKRGFFAPTPAPPLPTYPAYPDPFAGTVVSTGNLPAPFSGTVRYRGPYS